MRGYTGRAGSRSSVSPNEHIGYSSAGICIALHSSSLAPSEAISRVNGRPQGQQVSRKWSSMATAAGLPSKGAQSAITSCSWPRRPREPVARNQPVSESVQLRGAYAVAVRHFSRRSGSHKRGLRNARARLVRAGGLGCVIVCLHVWALGPKSIDCPLHARTSYVKPARYADSPAGPGYRSSAFGGKGAGPTGLMYSA